MTRKDYELIAGVLHNTDAKRAICEEMAEQLRRASGYTPNGNKSFDDDKFLQACGFNRPACPMCHEENKMNPKKVFNCLSRKIKGLYICTDCGHREAMENLTR